MTNQTHYITTILTSIFSITSSSLCETFLGSSMPLSFSTCCSWDALLFFNPPHILTKGFSENITKWNKAMNTVNSSYPSYCFTENNLYSVQPFGSLFRREVLNKDLLLKKVLIRSLFGPKGPYFQLSNPNNALYLLFFNLPREVIS